MKFPKRITSIIVTLLVICLPGPASEASRYEVDPEVAVYAWFCRSQLPNGLLRGTEGVDMCGLYQMACAAMVFTLYRDYERAARIFNFFDSRLVYEFPDKGTSERGFIMFRDSDGKPIATTNRWLGDNAWFLMAINYYREATGSTRYDKMAGKIIEWMEDMQDKEGKEHYREGDLGIWGGYEGAYHGKFMGYKSTEACIDAYAALAPYPDKQTFRAEIKQWIDTMYVPRDKRLKIGTTMDETDSEMQAWAVMTFLDPETYSLDYIDRTLKLEALSDTTNRFIVGFSYMPLDRAEKRLEITPTLAMTMAYHVAGQDRKVRFYIKEIEQALIESSEHPGTMGMPGVANKTRYFNNPTDVYNISSHSSAWYLFVKRRFNPFRSFKRHEAPAAE